MKIKEMKLNEIRELVNSHKYLIEDDPYRRINWEELKYELEETKDIHRIMELIDICGLSRPNEIIIPAV